uniref:TOD1/MUCI70 glycosyltransferase-like domain-containing protein n=1 Tax=Setaria viridis TaxID=4556 RepID=A0A4U6W3D6_SETVI|nr:hypothetical protein SEVIR_2G402450v2 [Setaria viridis]
MSHGPLTSLFMCLWFNEVVRFTSTCSRSPRARTWCTTGARFVQGEAARQGREMSF